MPKLVPLNFSKFCKACSAFNAASAAAAFSFFSASNFACAASAAVGKSDRLPIPFVEAFVSVFTAAHGARDRLPAVLFTDGLADLPEPAIAAFLKPGLPLFPSEFRI